MATRVPPLHYVFTEGYCANGKLYTVTVDGLPVGAVWRKDGYGRRWFFGSSQGNGGYWHTPHGEETSRTRAARALAKQFGFKVPLDA